LTELWDHLAGIGAVRFLVGSLFALSKVMYLGLSLTDRGKDFAMSRTSLVGRCVLLVTLAFQTLAPSQALGQQIKMRPVPTQQQKEEQWKHELEQKGIGEKSKWEARLQDGRKIKGYLSEIREDGFTLVNTKTDENSRVAFSELKSLKRQGLPWQVPAGIAGAVFGGLVVAGLVAASRE